MLRRPRAGETEQDLLAFQESFISSGEQPAVSLAGGDGAGNKRKKRIESDRDIVELGGMPLMTGVEAPTTKRSKFKQQADKILEDIRDNDVIDRPVTMPTRVTKRGFPSVHELDWKKQSPHKDTHTHSQKKKKKKSLFAQQFDTHSIEYFGFEFKPTNQTTACERDKVEPFMTSSTSLDTEYKATPTLSSEEGMTEYASKAWTNLLDSTSSDDHTPSSSSLISGEGLVRTGVSVTMAEEEIKKIHCENVERLSAVTCEELQAEKERVEQKLGPELVEFLKKRKRMVAQRKEEGEGEVESCVGEIGEEVEKGGGGEKDKCVERCEETGMVVPPNWLHMDEIEKEKTEWMTDVLPDNTQEGGGGGSVRFSLDGLIIPHGISLPTQSALYHHGDEPASAGYTLMELLGLIRSTVPQQRVLSLSTLAKIMNKAWRGSYNGIVTHCVLSALCEAGLPLMLRYAVDDSFNAVISAALTALHHLIIPQWEEVLLCEMCSSFRGSSIPHTGLPTKRREQETSKKDEGEGREDDDDSTVFDRDVIEGYLATGLLRRLRYLLEVVCLGPLEVQTSLEIFTRISRHSLHAAVQVVECPRLMDVVFTEFLPLVWLPQGEDDSKSVYGVPQPAAMRLIQVITSASRNLSTRLLSHNKLLEVIVRYTVPHPSELALPASQAYSLSLTALETGKGLLQYGLATDWIRDCYPVLARSIFALPSLSISSLPLHEASYLAALIWLLEPAITLQPSSLLPPALTSSLLPPLLSAISKWMKEEGCEEIERRMVCMRATLHVIASHLNNLISYSSHTSQEVNAMDVVEMAAALSSPSGLLVTIFDSPLMVTCLNTLRETSPFWQKTTPSHLSSPPSSLPSLHTTYPVTTPPAIYGGEWKEDDYGFLKPYLVNISSVDFLLGFLRLCLAASSTHKGVVSRVTVLLDNQTFREYVARVCDSPPVKYSSVSLGEFQLLYTSVILFMKRVTAGLSCNDVILYHRLSFHLLTILPPGMEYAVDNLLATVVFHPALYPELSSLPESMLEDDINDLSLCRHPPQSLSSSLRHIPLSSLLASTESHLPSISSTLLTSLRTSVYTQHRLETSRRLFLSQSPSITPSPSPSSSSSNESLTSLHLPHYSSPLLPADWFMLPLISLYQQSLSSVSCDLGSEVIVAVRNSLNVQFLLEELRSSFLSHLPPSTRLARTLITFLIGNDIFMDSEVRPLLSSLLTVYYSHSIQQNLNLTLPIPGLSSFHSLYQSLLCQYAAVSYGDPLFSCFILLPLQRRYPVSLRHTVWDQHSHILRLLSLPLDQLPVKLDCFLLPPETDHHLLDFYTGALVTGSVQPQWSPIMYLTAVHHVHHFLFPETKEISPDESVFHKKLLSAVQHMQRKDTQTHILSYDGPTLNSTLGFRMKM